jgi:Family of unknown function (DUF6338)
VKSEYDKSVKPVFVANGQCFGANNNLGTANRTPPMPDLTPDKLLLFALFVIPGLVAIRTWSLWCPGPKADWGNSLGEAITYSVLNLAIWHRWIRDITKKPYDDLSIVEVSAAIVLICFLSPAILASGWYKLRANVLHQWLGIDHPTPRGWEYHLNKNRRFWVLFHLKSGKMLGGLYAGSSYAATFPQEPELYVEKVYSVDDNGKNWKEIEDTIGMVIRLSECERLEFFKIKEKNHGTKSESGDGPTREGNAGPAATGGDGRCDTGEGRCNGPSDGQPAGLDHSSRGIGNGIDSTKASINSANE